MILDVAGSRPVDRPIFFPTQLSMLNTLVSSKVGRLITEESHSGGMAEWLKAPVLKTGEVQASGGSTPSPSATSSRFPQQQDSWVEN